MDFGRKKIRLGEILVSSQLITQEQLQHALQEHRKAGKKLGEYLIEQGMVTEDALVNALSQQLGLDTVDLDNVTVEKAILDMVSMDVLKKNVVFPYGFREDNLNVLRVAMADPLDYNAQDDINLITNYQVEPVVATSRSILNAIDKFYGQKEMSGKLEAYAKEKKLTVETNEQEEESVNSSPIVTLVKEMIEKAARQRASDIHLEPMETYIRLRYRIDGALYERDRYTPSILSSVIARIKIIGGMDISEKRKPQDGRITQYVDRVEYDIRVSILPTVYGEKVVMRLAMKANLNREKSQLGLKPYEMAQLDHILKNPNGIILVTGPTGSGKSTTLYTCLSELNTEDVNIITVEDPVEANIDGINQVQTNNKADLTFASALRSILRQDPDIICVGEIRDGETAEIAMRSAITGHVVLSTIHTSDAIGTVERLIDMGVEPYLVASAVKGVFSQRLVRRICPDCREEYHPDEDEQESLGLTYNPDRVFYRGKGCPKCFDTGYRGRTGVFEIFSLNIKVRRMIAKGAGREAIEEALTDPNSGFVSLRQNALALIAQGVTTSEEVLRVIYEDI